MNHPPASWIACRAAGDREAVREKMQSAIITTSGCFLSVLDSAQEASCIARLAHAPSPRERLRIAGDLRLLGEMTCWTTVLDGTVSLGLATHSTKLPAYDDNILRGCLWVPTGDLVIRTGDLGGPHVKLGVVEQGWYALSVQWSVDAESRHYDIARTDDYPADGGFDGTLHLLWMGASRPMSGAG